jgi:hypothetical protein
MGCTSHRRAKCDDEGFVAFILDNIYAADVGLANRRNDARSAAWICCGSWFYRNDEVNVVCGHEDLSEAAAWDFFGVFVFLICLWRSAKKLL